MTMAGKSLRIRSASSGYLSVYSASAGARRGGTARRTPRPGAAAGRLRNRSDPHRNLPDHPESTSFLWRWARPNSAYVRLVTKSLRDARASDRTVAERFISLWAQDPIRLAVRRGSDQLTTWRRDSVANAGRSRSHSLTVPSSQPEAIVFPSGE